MPFYARIGDALSRSSSALSQLFGYDHHAHPRSHPNAAIRDNARRTLDPGTWQIEQGVREGRWERVPRHAARQALRAAELIRRATWDLSDLPSQGRPTNVYQAQRNIREAVDLLQRARW